MDENGDSFAGKYDLNKQYHMKTLYPAEELNKLKDQYRYIVDIAQPYLNIIAMAVPAQNSLIDMCTDDGIIFHRIGRAPDLESAGYTVGCTVTSGIFQNNALGTCIDTGCPATACSNEHVLDIFKDWSCYAVPIVDINEKIKCAVGIIVPKNESNDKFLHLAVLAAAGISEALKWLNEESRLNYDNELLLKFAEGILKIASVLSHEIRNSLSTISAYIQLLQLEKSLDNNKGEKILSEVSRINKLLYQFSNLSKPIRPNFNQYSLNEILQSTVELAKAKAKINNVNIHINIMTRDLYIMADRDSIIQVFLNLIMNAIQAMGNGGKLTINMSVDDSSNAIILFQDTGIGISENNIKEIFSLFYTTKKTGNGLGLAICSTIIKAHNGEIGVESTVGVGTTFTVKLPYVQ